MQILNSQMTAKAANDALGTSQLERIESLATQGKEAEAAGAFESLFAQMLVKEMRNSVEGGFFGEGPGADTYGEWFDKEMGASIAADGGLGLAGVLKAQLGIERLAKETSAADDVAPEVKS